MILDYVKSPVIKHIVQSVLCTLKNSNVTVKCFTIHLSNIVLQLHRTGHMNFLLQVHFHAKWVSYLLIISHYLYINTSINNLHRQQEKLQFVG